MNIPNRISNLALLGLLTGSLWAQQPTGREIMERYKAQDRTQDLSAEQTMTLTNSRGGERERRLTYVTRTDADGNRRMLVRFLAPADVARTGFLSIERSDRDDDRWLYLPALRKTRRIAGSDKTDKFVGSEFTYEDLDSEKLDLHEYTLIGSETVDGVDAWVIEAVATDPERLEETGYSKRELWISKVHYLVIQAKYYDGSGGYVKLFRATDIRQIPNSEKWRAYHMTMEDVRKGNKTTLQVLEYEIDQGIPDRYFSERYLKRGG
ncbi:MAG: outer membrane lipoprotein-sorting protein [Gemmatimonadales bacterium]|nr:outer membrane lipoprotein-sorting protein [Gemmatimonadales bacterium]NIN12078.1 outer membrane lipoprotein-sorting protein [Gemmatimonadales bacterium]NIR03313.1 outer membrane lipoprotein-sorting protein [Gemmatimonadales bacterium]NIS66993.1 outer membrane lipoprotein-sorting protein [Gemmatimonadales bacterium]